MSNLSDSTGMQNPIFKLLEKSPVPQQDLSNINTNSLRPIQIKYHPIKEDIQRPIPGQIIITTNPVNPSRINYGTNQTLERYGPMIHYGGSSFGYDGQIFQQGEFNYPNNKVNKEKPKFQPKIDQIKKQSQYGLNVIFRRTGYLYEKNGPIMVQCMPDEKVSELIKRYRERAKDDDPKKQFVQFVYGAKKLNPDLTVADAKIVDNALIFVNDIGGVKGGF